MAETCYELVSDGETDEHHPQSPSSNLSILRKRMEIQHINNVTDAKDIESKRLKTILTIHSCDNTEKNNNNVVGENSNNDDDDKKQQPQQEHTLETKGSLKLQIVESVGIIRRMPKFGVAAVCGRRRHMEDAVAIHPSLVNPDFHYFAVYDGHGCSHVSMKCKERLHELVKQEISLIINNNNDNNSNEEGLVEWQVMMEKCFGKMDEEAIACVSQGIVGKCRCELQTPECHVVGSTAVVSIVTPHKIIVANCGDSRAVLCKNGRAIPLSTDHKPDRPDELNRIQEAGGKVIDWDGPRVLGMLNMSRAIGDSYLKPFVSSEPEVTITDRTVEDECLILASDGLWDVVSNDTACRVARMCLRGKKLPPEAAALLPPLDLVGLDGIKTVDKACNDASILLTKLALARNTGDNVSVVVLDLNRRRRRTKKNTT